MRGQLMQLLSVPIQAGKPIAGVRGRKHGLHQAPLLRLQALRQRAAVAGKQQAVGQASDKHHVPRVAAAHECQVGSAGSIAKQDALQGLGAVGPGGSSGSGGGGGVETRTHSSTSSAARLSRICCLSSHQAR